MFCNLPLGFVTVNPFCEAGGLFFIIIKEIRVIMETKLYVGNLSYDTTEDDLRVLFAQAGNVVSVALIKDRDSGMSKGFAFVEMGNQAEMEKAIQMLNHFSLGERELNVSVARPREERNRSGFNNDRRGGPQHRGRGGMRRY